MAVDKRCRFHVVSRWEPPPQEAGLCSYAGAPLCYADNDQGDQGFGFERCWTWEVLDGRRWTDWGTGIPEGESTVLPRFFGCAHAWFLTVTGSGYKANRSESPRTGQWRRKRVVDSSAHRDPVLSMDESSWGAVEESWDSVLETRRGAQ